MMIDINQSSELFNVHLFTDEGRLWRENISIEHLLNSNKLQSEARMDGMYKVWSNRAAPVFLQHGACCQHGLIIVNTIIIITIIIVIVVTIIVIIIIKGLVAKHGLIIIIIIGLTTFRTSITGICIKVIWCNTFPPKKVVS